MAVTYKKLWHLLIDRNLMKKDLEEMAGITHYQMCKLARDKDVTTEVLGAVCKALNVRVEDIMDFVPDDKEQVRFLGHQDDYNNIRVSFGIFSRMNLGGFS